VNTEGRINEEANEEHSNVIEIHHPFGKIHRRSISLVALIRKKESQSPIFFEKSPTLKRKNSADTDFSIER
jgi:hypothetical protein